MVWFWTSSGTSNSMRTQRSSMSMFCSMMALLFIAGYANCKTASSFVFENRHSLSLHQNQNRILAQGKFQEEEKLFREASYSFQNRNKCRKIINFKNRGDLLRSRVISSVSISGGDVVSQDTSTSSFSSRNALFMTGGLLLIMTELYAQMPFSVIASPTKFVLDTILSVGFWSAVAPFASICLKLSPMPTILKLRYQEDVGGLPLLPYSAMCTLTFVLAVYGSLKGDLKIMLTHGIGHILSIFYCLSYLKKCPSTATHLPGSPKLHKLISGSIMSATCLAVIFCGKKAANFAGASSVILSSLMYIGPLSVIKSAIQDKSSRNIPLPFAIYSFINSLAWSVYGFFKINDWMIYTPCMIGFTSATTQLLLNFIFRTKQKEV